MDNKTLPTQLTRYALGYADPLPRDASAEERLLWNQTLALVDYDACNDYYAKDYPLDAEEAAAAELCKTLKPALKELKKNGNLPEEDLDYAELPDRDEGEAALPWILDPIRQLIRFIGRNPARRAQFAEASQRIYGGKKPPPLPSLEDTQNEEDDAYEAVLWTKYEAQVQAVLRVKLVFVFLIETEPRLYRKFELPPGEWAALENFGTTLALVSSTAKVVANATLGEVLCLYGQAMRALLEPADTASAAIRKVTRVMREYMQACFDRALASRPLVLATLLDPRFRLEFFAHNHPEYVERVKSVLREAVAELSGEATQDAAAAAEKEIDDYFSDKWTFLVPDEEDEVDEDDALTWCQVSWRAHRRH